MRKRNDERIRVNLYEYMSRFKSDQDAMQYIESIRWADGRTCPLCGSKENSKAIHKTMPYWCRQCRKYFSVKTGTLMEDSRLPYKKWLMAIYLVSTSLKGVASTKLGNDIGVRQSTAWFLNHRIRTAWAKNTSQLFGCEVEADESYISGKEKNKHKHEDKKLNASRGAVGETTVVGIKERDGKNIKSFKIPDTKAVTLRQIICDSGSVKSTIYTDDSITFEGLEQHVYKNETVKHSVGEYVKGQMHIDGVELLWTCFERGCGPNRKMSPKHLQKYVDEFEARSQEAR